MILIRRIIARSTLRSFWEQYPDAEQSLKAWFNEASRADWQNPSDIKSLDRNASIIANNRVVSNIKSNDYHLIVYVIYDMNIIFIRSKILIKPYSSFIPH